MADRIKGREQRSRLQRDRLGDLGEQMCEARVVAQTIPGRVELEGPVGQTSIRRPDESREDFERSILFAGPGVEGGKIAQEKWAFQRVPRNGMLLD